MIQRNPSKKENKIPTGFLIICMNEKVSGESLSYNGEVHSTFLEWWYIQEDVRVEIQRQQNT